MRLRESYDSAAQAYAEHLATELEGKPLDRHLLNRFAEEMQGRGFTVTERVEREPYEGAEYPSRRCYLLARAT